MLPLAGSFEFIQAKVHGLRSRVYEAERLDALCDLRTVAQLWHRLYPDAEPGDHHQLQRRLLADHVQVLETVRRHLPSGLVTLYGWMMRRFQTENLKVLLRGWKARLPAERVLPFLAPMLPDFTFDPKPFLKASGLADFVALIPVSEFRASAEKAAALYADTGETFILEAALDVAYYTGLLQRHRALPGVHRAGTEALVRNEVALYDVLTLFRLKLNYGLRYEQGKPLLVPGGLGATGLERIYDYPDFGDMVRLIPGDLLPRRPLSEIQTTVDLERALWERFLQRANTRFYQSVGDLGAPVAFYTVKRAELANLFRVVEGVRYGLEPEAIRAGMIRPLLSALVR